MAVPSPALQNGHRTQLEHSNASNTHNVSVYSKVQNKGFFLKRLVIKENLCFPHVRRGGGFMGILQEQNYHFTVPEKKERSRCSPLHVPKYVSCVKSHMLMLWESCLTLQHLCMGAYCHEHMNTFMVQGFIGEGGIFTESEGFSRLITCYFKSKICAPVTIRVAGTLKDSGN